MTFFPVNYRITNKYEKNNIQQYATIYYDSTASLVQTLSLSVQQIYLSDIYPAMHRPRKLITVVIIII